MRLTLRTLLAYLDDTLEPTQAKAIGQKIAESDAARELIERIRQVSRRRRLTTPSSSGPGGVIDPNTVAEYLDNEVTAEQAAEVEQICLASDVHLAEVAACHQILTLVLGEPIKPAQETRERMYGLAAGADASSSKAQSRAPSGRLPESAEIDETLRLGLPPLGRRSGWRSPLVFIGGGLVAAGLLVFVILQVIDVPQTANHEPKQEAVGQNETTASDTGHDGSAIGAKAESAGQPRGYKKGPTFEETGQEKKAVAEVIALPPDEVIPLGPPNLRSAPIGNYQAGDLDTGILLESFPDNKMPWRRVSGKQPEVLSARPLVSLPASRSVVDTHRGVRVTLWGNSPEFVAQPPIYESVVELYAHDKLDLDMRLLRGRVILSSTKKDKPVRVRLRFENPMIVAEKEFIGREEFFDITLKGLGAALLVDRWSHYSGNEPFSKNPKNPRRVGPSADMACIVVSGSVFFRAGDTGHAMSPPPGSALVVWNALKGVMGPLEMEKLPAFALTPPESEAAKDGKGRKEVLQGRQYLSAQLAKGGGIDVALAQALTSDDLTTRRLAVRSLGAISDLPSLVEALEQPKYPDVRLVAIDTLSTWIAAARDHDYKLFDLLKTKYKNKEAEIIMELLHGFADAEWRRPERYELLIDYLVNPNLVIRELGAWRLYQKVPAGGSIPYSAAADSQRREQTATLWRVLIPPGQLPPASLPLKK